MGAREYSQSYIFNVTFIKAPDMPRAGLMIVTSTRSAPSVPGFSLRERDCLPCSQEPRPTACHPGPGGAGEECGGRELMLRVCVCALCNLPESCYYISELLGVFLFNSFVEL